MEYRSIFDCELTQEEWENREEWLKFNNEDLQADAETLEEVYNEVMNRMRLQHSITKVSN